jgi:hypothetical protein
LGGRIILYVESEKIGPEMICRPPIFPLMRFTLTTTLNNLDLNFAFVVVFKEKLYIHHLLSGINILYCYLEKEVGILFILEVYKKIVEYL